MTGSYSKSVAALERSLQVYHAMIRMPVVRRRTVDRMSIVNLPLHTRVGRRMGFMVFGVCDHGGVNQPVGFYIVADADAGANVLPYVLCLSAVHRSSKFGRSLRSEHSNRLLIVASAEIPQYLALPAPCLSDAISL